MRKLKGISYGILISIICLLWMLTLSGSSCAQELAYDKGRCDASYLVHPPPLEGGGGPQQLQQEFILSDFGLTDPYKVGKVRIHWWQGFTNFAGVIQLLDHDNPDNAVTLSFVNPLENTWQDYDVSGLGFSSSHFYVQVLWASGYGAVCSDTPSLWNRSYADPGVGTYFLVPADFGIRVDTLSRPLGALPAKQCINLFQGTVTFSTDGGTQTETEKLSMSVANDFNGCIIESSATFYKSSDCSGTPITPTWQDPDLNFVYKSGTRGGCAEAIEVTSSSPVCVQLTLQSGRKTTVCY